MENHEVMRVINDMLKKKAEKCQVDAEYVIKNLLEVVERCMQRAPVLDFVPKEGMVQAQDEAGRDVWQFDSKGAAKALELLGKHLKLFTEKHEHSGTVTYEVVDYSSAIKKPELRPEPKQIKGTA